MEAKDKAKALVEKYFEELFEYIPNIADRMKAAKQCALIACAEVLKQWEYVDTHIADLGGQLSPNYKFWLEVEQEINQL